MKAALIVGWVLLICSGWCARAVTLVRDGRAVAKIYVSGPLVVDAKSKKPPAERAEEEAPIRARAEAVRDLNYHLEKMGGAALEVVQTDDVAAVKGPGVVLGKLAVAMGAAPKAEVKSEEAFRLLAKDDLLLIGGRTDAGMLHGVYTVLNRLGCDWVMPGEIGEVIPRRTTVEIDALDESQAPDFAMRNLWYNGGAGIITAEEEARFALWKRRQRMGTAAHMRELGTGHAWQQLIEKHRKEFEKDPTMLALVRGPDGGLVRRGPQIESTHPRVVELYVQDIKEAFEKNKWPKDRVAAFPIGPADGLGYSMSVESVQAGSGRIDPVTGDPDVTDLVVLLGNQILEKLGDEYPNVRLGFYIYSVHGDFPARHKPHPRLNAIFAPINFSRYHGFEDENSKTRAYYKGVVEAWGKLAAAQGNVLAFRGYNWNLAENIVPFSQLRMLGSDIPFYKRAGFTGCNQEAVNGWATNGPHNYLLARLLWDASPDWKQVLKEYCGKSFGTGGAAMERYLLRLVERQHLAGQEAGSYYAIHLIFDDAFVAAGEADLKEALAAAQMPAEKTRVEYLGTALEGLKIYLRYHAATMRFDFAAARAAYDALHAHWAKTIAINSDLTSQFVPRYLKGLVGGFVEGAEKYSGDPYRVVYRIPDELQTAMDPTAVGHLMRMQNPAVNDAQWLRSRTYSTTWDAQGLGTYKGAVWYHVRFKLPAEAARKPVGLFLGSFEDEARVWCNGKSIGTSGVNFGRPSVFDLTDDVSYDGENMVAVQVIRNSAANEIGLGGIMRPSFVFTGPRLERKAPKVAEPKRVLPGAGGT